MIFFRVVQVAMALMFPAALAIVVAVFDIRERGKAMATFFGVTGGLTAIGPLAGGYITEITWRAIFWVNVPVAIIALILTAKSNLSNESTRRRSTTAAPCWCRAAWGWLCSACSSPPRSATPPRSA